MDLEEKKDTRREGKDGEEAIAPHHLCRNIETWRQWSIFQELLFGFPVFMVPNARAYVSRMRTLKKTSVLSQKGTWFLSTSAIEQGVLNQ